MTIDEAIKHLERKVKQKVFQVDPEAFTALKLGNEALKYLKVIRSTGVMSLDYILPGETKEGS